MKDEMSQEDIYDNARDILEKVANMVFKPKDDDEEFAVQLFLESILNLKDKYGEYYSKEELIRELDNLWDSNDNNLK